MQRLIGNSIIFICLTILTSPSFGKAVRVNAKNGEQGHAWLFGAEHNRQIKCWLAVPLHVIADQNNQPQPFIYTDRSNNKGESSKPISISDIEGGLDATHGISDLAFAEVEIDSSQTACDSRLGLNAFSYNELLKTLPNLTLQSIVKTSSNYFNGKVIATGNSTASGLMDIAASHQADANRFFKKGLSGSVAEVQYKNNVLPFAMILKVEGQRKAKALRFDLIAKAFKALQSSSLSNELGSKVAINNPYQLISYKADSKDETMGASSLLDPTSCWEISLQDGERAIELIIDISSEHSPKINTLTLNQNPSCQTRSSFEVFVFQKVGSSSSWNSHSNCESTGSQARCFINLKTPRKLKLLIKPSSSDASLSSLSIN